MNYLIRMYRTASVGNQPVLQFNANDLDEAIRKRDIAIKTKDAVKVEMFVSLHVWTKTDPFA